MTPLHPLYLKFHLKFCSSYQHTSWSHFKNRKYTPLTPPSPQSLFSSSRSWPDCPNAVLSPCLYLLTSKLTPDPEVSMGGPSEPPVSVKFFSNLESSRQLPASPNRPPQVLAASKLSLCRGMLANPSTLLFPKPCLPPPTLPAVSQCSQSITPSCCCCSVAALSISL